MAGEILGRWFSPEARLGGARTFEQHLDVHLAVGEMGAVADVDLLAPEADALIGTVASRLCAEAPAYDQARLSPRPPHDVRQLQGALERVLCADLSSPVSSEDSALKEARLHRLLHALRAMGDHIRAHGSGQG